MQLADWPRSFGWSLQQNERISPRKNLLKSNQKEKDKLLQIWIEEQKNSFCQLFYRRKVAAKYFCKQPIECKKATIPGNLFLKPAFPFLPLLCLIFEPVYGCHRWVFPIFQHFIDFQFLLNGIYIKIKSSASILKCSISRLKKLEVLTTTRALMLLVNPRQVPPEFWFIWMSLIQIKIAL